MIITSATIDTEKFSKAFNDASVIEVSGRLYPVEVQYHQPDSDQAENGELTHVDLATKAAMRLLKQRRRGDILVFMPTEQDIRETQMSPKHLSQFPASNMLSIPVWRVSPAIHRGPGQPRCR